MENYVSEPEAQNDNSDQVVETQLKKPEKNKKRSETLVEKDKKTEKKASISALDTKQQNELLKIRLEAEFRSQIEAELKLKIETELIARLEVELKPKLEADLKSKLLAEISPQIKKDINPESEDAIECNMDTKRIVEAILFAANKPMTAKQVQNVYPELERPELNKIQAAINSIIDDYTSRPVGLKQLASGYRFQVKDGYSYWVSRLFEEKPAKYSRALLETIAIIAYRQPVTRGDIEDIRGVSVSTSIIRTLLEREWIRVIAHKEVPGRPALYGTSKQFLDYFNLSSLEGLPTLEEIKELDFSSNNALNFEKQQNQLDAEMDSAIDNNSTEENSESDSEKQLIEEQASEAETAIEPISETRH